MSWLIYIGMNGELISQCLYFFCAEMCIHLLHYVYVYLCFISGGRFSLFGFDGRTMVLIAPIPDHCLPLAFPGTALPMFHDVLTCVIKSLK